MIPPGYNNGVSLGNILTIVTIVGAVLVFIGQSGVQKGQFDQMIEYMKRDISNSNTQTQINTAAIGELKVATVITSTTLNRIDRSVEEVRQELKRK